MKAAGRRAKLSEPEHSALDAVNAFLVAIEAHDFERAETLLSADSFSYIGPIDCFDDARVFTQDISRIESFFDARAYAGMFDRQR